MKHRTEQQPDAQTRPSQIPFFNRQMGSNAVVQTKLTVGFANDAHEHEANQTADMVMRKPDVQRIVNPLSDVSQRINNPLHMVQRACAHCEQEKEQTAQRKETSAATGGFTAPPSVSKAISRSGQGLDSNAKTFMESRFNRSFDNVQVHTDGESAASARDISARAYTSGNHIVFGDGQYQPNTEGGRHLLAHELTHTIQQQGNFTQIQRYTDVVGQPYDKLSDDGKMAVHNHGREAWAEPTNIAKSNLILANQYSKAKIKELANDITVTPPNNASAKPIKLKKFHMIDAVSGAEVELTDDCGGANQQLLGADKAGYESFVGVTKNQTKEEYTGSSSYRADDLAPGGSVSTTEQMSGEIYIKIFEKEFGKKLNRVDALKAWSKLTTAEQNRLSKKYGINKFAVPKVGQGVTIGTERDIPGATAGGYNFHFGLNLMASGQDYITLEDYASSGVKYYFDMYGPTSKKQSWAEAPSNVGALGNKTTTMVVQHPESLNGKTTATGVHLVDDPDQAVPTIITKLVKDVAVKIVSKGSNWMKVEVMNGPHLGKTGWILNMFFKNN